jgi:hypothetical protein
MFKLFAYGANKAIDINTFMREYVNTSKVDSEFPMFLVNFTDKIQELIEEEE